MTFLEFCEYISPTPLYDWQKTYILEMQKLTEAGHVFITMPRGRGRVTKSPELYVGFLYAVFKKAEKDESLKKILEIEEEKS